MTDLEICNSALLKCGNEKIVALSDQNKRAIAVNTQFPFIRDRLLFDNPWKFALKRVILTPELDDDDEHIVPAFGWEYQFLLPEDCLRPWDLDESLGNEGTQYEVEGGKILTDESEEIKLRYIAKITDSTTFDPLFCEALATLLAADVSYHLVQSSQLKKDLEEAAKEMVRTCRSFHAQQGTPRQYKINTFRGARR